jgi:hypothetical protein
MIFLTSQISRRCKFYLSTWPRVSSVRERAPVCDQNRLDQSLLNHIFLFSSYLICIMSFLASRIAAAAPRVGRTFRLSRSNGMVSTPRTFTSSVRVLASGPPVIQGEGGKVGEVATDEEQSTGLERFELLGRLQGVDVFDMEPLESARLGTKKEPIVVQSLVSILSISRDLRILDFDERRERVMSDRP